MRRKLSNKFRWNYLSGEEIKKRRKMLINELKRISQVLNKPVPTEYDFIFNSKLPIPPRSFITIFHNFGNFKKAAGFIKTHEEDFFINKKLELKRLFKQIALKHNNQLSLKIVMQELNKSASAVNGMVSPYFGGFFYLCKEIKAIYRSDIKSTNTRFNNHTHQNSAEISKQIFEKSVIEISKRHSNSLSLSILYNDSSLSPGQLHFYSSKWFGGFRVMCSKLRIIWVEGNHGINNKELYILKNIKDVYRASGNKISQNIYKKKGKYKLELVEDYFGSFGKACLEVNIQTDSMKEISK